MQRSAVGSGEENEDRLQRRLIAVSGDSATQLRRIDVTCKRSGDSARQRCWFGDLTLNTSTRTTDMLCLYLHFKSVWVEKRQAEPRIDDRVEHFGFWILDFGFWI